MNAVSSPSDVQASTRIWDTADSSQAFLMNITISLYFYRIYNVTGRLTFLFPNIDSSSYQQPIIYILHRAQRHCRAGLPALGRAGVPFLGIIVSYICQGIFGHVSPVVMNLYIYRILKFSLCNIPN